MADLSNLPVSDLSDVTDSISQIQLVGGLLRSKSPSSQTVAKLKEIDFFHISEAHRSLKSSVDQGRRGKMIPKE